MDKSKYYVYVAYGLNNEVLYVGQGQGGRYKHCMNGISHNKDLNRYYFKNGEGGSIRTEIIQKFETKTDAENFEQLCIDEMKPLFNIKGTPIANKNVVERVKYLKSVENHLYTIGYKRYSILHKNAMEKILAVIDTYGFSELLEGILISRRSLVKSHLKALRIVDDIIKRGYGCKAVCEVFYFEKLPNGFRYIRLNQHFLN